MALINSNQYALNPISISLPQLPVYMRPPLLDTSAPVFTQPTSSFDSQFHSEIANLERRRSELCNKIAQAQQHKPAPSAQEKKAIHDEYYALEQQRNLLKLFADATEKSRQSIAANMR